MAIEIIPKRTEVRNITLISTVFYFSVILLLATILISLLLLGLRLNLNRNISNVEAKIDSVATTEDLALERKITLTQDRINTFDYLFKNHKSNQKFLAAFEKLAHPKIFFAKIDLDMSKGRASLSGTTDNFEILGQQFLVLEKESYVKGVTLANAAIEDDGKVSFVFNIDFSNGNFKY